MPESDISTLLGICRRCFAKALGLLGAGTRHLLVASAVNRRVKKLNRVGSKNCTALKAL